MLSYRHAFHAGNFADVLKHLVLVNTLDYLCRKPAPVLYLDTHAGAGAYSLTSLMATHTGEAREGILKLDLDALEVRLPEDARPVLARYRECLAPFLREQHYPGSPALAAAVLRAQDSLRLFELHTTDFGLLAARFARDRRVTCEQGDGFHAIKALLPAAGKRAVVLIDPSYEIKEDFRRVAQAMELAWKRMPAAQVLLWYPVLRERQDEHLIRALVRSGMRDLWQFELGVAPNPYRTGMTASGILALNPPWTLPAQLREALPLLQESLAGGEGHWKVECLAPE